MNSANVSKWYEATSHVTETEVKPPGQWLISVFVLDGAQLSCTVVCD